MKKNTLLRSAIFFLTAFLNVCAAIGNQLPYYHSKEEFINASRNKLINDRSFQYKIEQRKENDYKQLGNYLKSSIENFDEAFVNSIYDLKKKEQRAFEKELQKRADWIIELLNQRIAKNTQLVKEGNDTETDYILDMRRSYGGSNEFISESKENILNVELRDLHKTTGKAIYVVLSPIFPEQLSYGAQAQDKTSGKLTKTAKDYTFYTSSFNEQERKRFAQKYTNYIAERSHLSNKSTSGGILHIESLMRYDALKKKWCMNFMDFMAFSKNINPQVAAKVAEDIRRDKTRKAIAFTNYTQVLESSLSDYVEVISWNWRAAFVDVNAKNRPNYPMGKYKVLLSQLSVEDKKSIKNILDKQNPSTYSPAKGNLTDYANMESYLEKIISTYTSRSRNTHGVKLKIITTSDKNNPGGMNAMQLAGNENPSAKTVVLGFHFSEENGNVWLYWNVKYSTDLANALPQNLMDNLWREVGSSTIYDKSINLYYDFVDNVVLPAVDSGKYIVAWGLERAYQFMDMLLAIYEAGRIPESWYTNGGWMTFPGGPLLAGILNALIDDIVGIYDLAKLVLIDIPKTVCDGIISIANLLYDYSTDKVYREAINNSLRQLANNTFELVRGAVQTLAYASGYQYALLGNISSEEYERPEVINKLVRNLKSIDIEKLDGEITSTLSTPFIWLGNQLEGCYGISTDADRKQYCSGYIVVSVVLCFTGIEELALAGKAAKGAQIAKAFSKLKLKEYIEKLLGVSKKTHRVVDDAVSLLLKRMPSWATDLVIGAKNLEAKVVAIGNDIVIYTKNGVDELCRITSDGVKNIRNWIDELEIKISYKKYSLEQAVYITEKGEKVNGPIVLMRKDDGEFFFKRPQTRFANFQKIKYLSDDVLSKINIWDESLLSKLDTDLGNADLLKVFQSENGSGLVDSWKVIKTVDGQALAAKATNIAELEFVSKNIDDVARLGGYKEWNRILRGAVKNGDELLYRLSKIDPPKFELYKGDFYRTVDNGLDPLHTHPIPRGKSHRYSKHGEDALYFSSSKEGNIQELAHWGKELDGNTTTYLYKNIESDNLLDLTNPKVREQLGINLDQITGESYEFTHVLGSWGQGKYNGIIAPSARGVSDNKYFVNIVIFKSGTANSLIKGKKLIKIVN